jgi:hypothetical protein
MKDGEETVDQFTISFDRTGDRSADMVFSWIDTEIRVPVALP